MAFCSPCELDRVVSVPVLSKIGLYPIDTQGVTRPILRRCLVAILRTESPCIVPRNPAHQELPYISGRRADPSPCACPHAGQIHDGELHPHSIRRSSSSVTQDIQDTQIFRKFSEKQEIYRVAKPFGLTTRHLYFGLLVGTNFHLKTIL